MNSNSGLFPPSLLNIEIKHQPGGSDPLIPYVISPRMTFLLNGTPKLRWNAVPGATSYWARIIRGSDQHWEKEVNCTEAVYPGDPPLEPGVAYLLTVEADNGASSLGGDEAKLGFTLLNKENVQRVHEGEQELAKLDLTGEARTIALALLYSRLAVRADAIEILEALVKQESQTASVYSTLGDLYVNTGLNLLAQASYSNALKLASTVQDSEVLTVVQLRLAALASSTTQPTSRLQGQNVITPKEFSLPCQPWAGCLSNHSRRI